MSRPALQGKVRFDKGITGLRDSAFHQHFDVFSDPSRLIPYRSTEAEANSTSAANLGSFDLRNFQLGKDGKMYALGNDGSAHPQVFVKADPTTGLWAPDTTAAGNAAIIYGAFIEWAGAFWGFQGTNQVWKYVLSTDTITNTVTGALGSTIVTVAQWVVGADDNLYGFYNNKVIRVSNAGVVTDDVLANLPSDMRITSACRWGTYIIITMAYGTSATASPTGVSKAFVWDMVTSTTVNDVIDLGEGAALVCGNIEGRIVFVSNKYLETPSGLTSLALGQGSMVVRMWSGSQAQIFKEIVANQVVTLGRFIRDVVVRDNKIYWVASVPFGSSTSTESTYHLGIWAFGRKDKDSDFTLSLDYVEEAIDTANYKINSFGAAGSYWFINHGAAGLVHKTDDSANYTYTSVYETEVFWDGKETNNVIGVSVTTDPLPSAGQVVLKYKKDAETSFTTIYTHNDDDSLRHSAVNIEGTGVNLPQYKRIRLRVESTGGAVITGIFLFREHTPDDKFNL
ncbi:MAG: hypothetical protein KBD16_00590 [Candidatus Pacebacteria bacterium]|nr:hypothetical protein [Candidatus Paceibacterota bacterium]